MITDENLIDEIKSGSQAAMEVLVKRYYSMVFSYTYRKTGDYNISYDITQEIFIKMIKSINSYKFIGKFKSFIMTITVNCCRDYFRSRSFKNVKTQEEIKDDYADQSSNVWDIFRKDYRREKVKKAVLSLNEEQREAIILRFYYDLKIKDIAGITGVCDSTVKSRLKQGIDKLRKIMEGGIKDEDRERRI